MEFKEYPFVEGLNSRNYTFPELFWLTKAKFEQILLDMRLNKARMNVNPCLNKLDDIDKRIFIGKTIPKPVDAEQSLDYTNLEMIGNVFKSSDKKWKLKITYQGRSFEIDNDFLILNIPDEDSYFWSSQPVFSNIPKFAFKAAVNKKEYKFNYIGRTVQKDTLDELKRPKFYSNAWLLIDDKLEQTFGKVDKVYKLLFAPYKDLEIGFDEFEFLCLTPSPASLKVLSRSALRAYLNYSQKNIKHINKNNQHLLPDSLINFLKYPSHLNLGDFLLKDEKLVDENDNYELSYDAQTGSLICRSLKCDKKCVLIYDADCIIVKKFYTIFYNNFNSKATTTDLINQDYLSSYKFFINWDNQTFQIKSN